MEADSKVELRTESEGDVEVETLWAKHLGDNRFKLLNTPFFAYGVSFGDVIQTDDSADGGFPLFARVLEKSGHSLVRVIFDPPTDESDVSQSHLDRLVQIGCTYEGASPAFVCIDIPPDVELDVVVRYLIDSDLQWEHADPTYAELYPES